LKPKKSFHYVAVAAQRTNRFATDLTKQMISQAIPVRVSRTPLKILK